VKPHYRLTNSADAIASDDYGDLIPYLFPSEDDCDRCVNRIRHFHDSEFLGVEETHRFLTACINQTNTEETK
jgi:hypothetical protein